MQSIIRHSLFSYSGRLDSPKVKAAVDNLTTAQHWVKLAVPLKKHKNNDVEIRSCFVVDLDGDDDETARYRGTIQEPEEEKIDLGIFSLNTSNLLAELAFRYYGLYIYDASTNKFSKVDIEN